MQRSTSLIVRPETQVSFHFRGLPLSIMKSSGLSISSFAKPEDKGKTLIQSENLVIWPGFMAQLSTLNLIPTVSSWRQYEESDGRTVNNLVIHFHCGATRLKSDDSARLFETIIKGCFRRRNIKGYACSQNNLCST